MKDFFLRHLHQHTIDDAMQLWGILQDRDFRTLFLRPTENTIIQLIRYGITGVTSFLVDYLLLYSLERSGAHYLIAAALAFLMGISCNFLLTKHFAFRAVDAAVRPGAEVVVFGAISAGGLGLTLLLLYLFTTRLRMQLMLAKFVSSLLVFAWNFSARKLFLYPGQPHEETGKV